jgi:hypothetical protein
MPPTLKKLAARAEEPLREQVAKMRGLENRSDAEYVLHKLAAIVKYHAGCFVHSNHIPIAPWTDALDEMRLAVLGAQHRLQSLDDTEAASFMETRAAKMAEMLDSFHQIPA